jgi:NTP pyrophosphatase (non-canonical NTP hydrolase)
MSTQDYQNWVISKDVKNYNVVSTRLAEEVELLRLFHAAVGVSGESGELLDAVKKAVIYGKKLDMTNVKEELGDILFYVTLAASSIGVNLDTLMQLNQDKLNKRYPTGYTDAAAVLRADKA